jgi:hypothetical protein
MSNDVFYYNLDDASTNLTGVEFDAVIHIGWITEDRTIKAQERSVKNSIELVRIASKLNAPFVFLSTATAGNPSSNYTFAKRKVENFLLEARETKIVRAGIVWGGLSFMGFLGVLNSLSNLPLFLLVPRDAGQFYLSEIGQLAEDLVEGVFSPDGSLTQSFEPDFYDLGEILFALRRRPLLARIPFTVSLLAKAARALRYSPFYPKVFDSVATLSSKEKSLPINSLQMSPNKTAILTSLKDWASSRKL